MTGGFTMIIAAVAAAAVAVFQFYLDTVLFRSVFESKPLTAIGMLLAKLALYAGAFALPPWVSGSACSRPSSSTGS